MKKIIIYVIPILLFTVTFCKREKRPANGNSGVDIVSSMPPPTIPTFTGDIRLKID